MGWAVICGTVSAADKEKGKTLLQEAAELGYAPAQIEFAEKCHNLDSLEQFVWLRRAEMQRAAVAFEFC